MNRSALFVLAFGLGVLAPFAARALRSDAQVEIDAATYRTALATLTDQRDEARARADSAIVAGLRADTVLVEVTDTVRVVIAAAQELAHETADSLRTTLDSVQSALLDTILVAHAEEVAAVWAIADARLSWGEGWRDAALVADSAARAERVRADLIETFQRAETSRANRTKRERDLAIVVNVIQAGVTLVGKVAG
ncbi:MAG: hypothetical protein ABL993_02590 [Vicinamibacterales bacterium]